MASRNFLALAFVLALAGLPAGADEPPVPAPDYLATVEGVPLAFTPDDLLANDQYVVRVVVEFVSAPRYGTLSCFDDVCTYQSDPGFVGEDELTYRLLYTGGASEEVPVRIRVSPQVIPLAGNWSGDGSVDLAWYWAPTQNFYFADLDLDLDQETARVSKPVACSHLPDSELGWLPVTGDWDGDGVDDVGLFDPVERTFHLFVRNEAWSALPEDLPHWLKLESFPFPGAGQGGLPLAGDWDGEGGDEVGLLLSNDAWVELAAAGGQDLFASFLFELPGPPEPLWLPVAADWGGDGGWTDYVGLYAPVGRQLQVRYTHADGPADVVLDYLDEETGMVPFTADFGHGESIGFYIPPSDGTFGGFVVYPYDFDPDEMAEGGRRPINAPPPEDPLSGVCYP